MSTNPAGPQPEFIKNLFASISDSYDNANDVITMGLARRWRRQLVQWSGVQKGGQVLDCATGTGDLALDFKAHVGSKGQVIGTDFCPEMIALAPQKANKKGLPVDFQVADAMNLPFEDNQFEVTSIAYGIRNVQDPVATIKEMARVTKPQGTVMVLETGEPKGILWPHLLRFHFHYLVPWLGGMVSGERQAYEYLNRSSSQFPSGPDFVELIQPSKAFSQMEYRSLMGGASYMYRLRVKSQF